MESKQNDASTLVLAYPETIVRVSEEWYSKFLPIVGIGKKGYVRAGHAALVLIKTSTGVLEYFDFGRYITPEPFGRVRSAETDAELKISLKAKFQQDSIINLKELLSFFSSNPELTHGDGKLIASLCKEVDYNKAKGFILDIQKKEFVRYGAFLEQATNCVRFVTDTLIASCTNEKTKKQLQNTKWFTPSSISNVIKGNTSGPIYEVYPNGTIKVFKANRLRTNANLFFDRLKGFNSANSNNGNIRLKSKNSQWLSGIGSGAWYQLIDLGDDLYYRFKRTSDCGRVDIDGKYRISNSEFSIQRPYKFLHNSNCLYFHIEQDNKIFRFDYLEVITS